MSDEPQLTISDIEIENFRGIKHLKISDFKRMNLFVGKNNSGKSSVLESLYLLICSYRKEIRHWANMLKARNPIYDEFYWDSLFYNFDSKKSVVVSANSETYKMEIQADFQRLKLLNEIGFALVSFGFPNQKQMDVSDGLVENQSEIHYAPLNLALTKTNISFLSTLALNEIIDSLADDFDKIQDAKLISLLSDTVRPIEPNIRDFRMSSKRAVKVDIASIPKLIPVNLLGDGMVRILGIVMKIANTKGGVVLIDEIESGFHYSTLETMWKAVLEVAKNFNVQIFATTHSKECLEAFARIESNDDDRRLFRLSKKGNETRVIPYTRENLATSFEIEVEVR